jgi:predicted ArsR family transcriptional regulator
MAKGLRRSHLEALATLRSPTRHALYEYIERQPTPVGRDQAAKAVGISRALAAFHLDRLVEAGLLMTDYRRLSGRTGPGAGRPSKLYRPSRRAVAISVPPREHELLAMLLAASARSDEESAALLAEARDFGRSLGARARQRVRSRPTPKRLAGCVKAVLERLGFEPYQAADNGTRMRNCPFEPLSRRYTPVVCGVGQALVGGVVEGVGSSELRVSRDEHPDRCCVVLS